MTISLINLGCKVNQYELQAIKTSLTSRGHSVYEDLRFADAYILNTCAVTNEAERKSRQFVAKALKKNPNAKIIVIGCASERNKNIFLNKGASYVSGSFDKSSIADRIDGLEKGEAVKMQNEKNEQDIEMQNAEKKQDGKNAEKSRSEGYREPDFASTGKSRQLIKIQDGCNNFCSYCIIPYLRGRSRSRREDDIIEEIKNVGLKEIVLIGINLGTYGNDTGTSLTEILGRAREVRPDLRLRLGSLEANVIDDEFLSEAAAENFCPHFHLSLQSGDDGVLRDMNRRYDARDFFEKTRLIRERLPDAAITTDIIVGFPTESAEAFENTLRFAEKAEFSDIHIFPYSAREGTAAANLKSVVSDGEVKERIRRLTELKYTLKKRYIERFVGKTLSVLVEENKDGEAAGYSENYIRVYVEGSLKIGDVYKVKIDGIYKDGAKGTVD